MKSRWTDVLRVLQPVTFKTCRHPDFGLASWGKEDTLQGTSGWRGGGYNQGAFCADYKNSVVSSRKLTGTTYKVEMVASGEEGRWTGRRVLSHYNNLSKWERNHGLRHQL